MDDEHIAPANLDWLLSGKLKRSERALVKAHLKRCRYCQEALESVAIMAPEPRPARVPFVAVAAAIAMALALGYWWGGVVPAGPWSVVEEPLDVTAPTPQGRLIDSAGEGRLTAVESDAIILLAALAKMEIELAPAVAGDDGERRSAIIAGCAALQAGDAGGAMRALAVFDRSYDITGSALLAVAGYAARSDSAERLLLQATAETTRAATLNRTQSRAAIWFLGRVLVETGDAEGARRAWAWLAAEEHSGTWSRLARGAIDSTLTR